MEGLGEGETTGGRCLSESPPNEGNGLYIWDIFSVCGEGIGRKREGREGREGQGVYCFSVLGTNNQKKLT